MNWKQVACHSVNEVCCIASLCTTPWQPAPAWNVCMGWARRLAGAGRRMQTEGQCLANRRRSLVAVFTPRVSCSFPSQWPKATYEEKWDDGADIWSTWHKLQVILCSQLRLEWTEESMGQWLAHIQKKSLFRSKPAHRTQRAEMDKTTEFEDR